MNRRQALARIGAASLYSSGAFAVPRIPECTTGTPPATDRPLAIDVHCHVCNASDLQVKDFIEKVVATEKHIDPALAMLLGYLAAKLAKLAPRAVDESSVLTQPGHRPGASIAQMQSLRARLDKTADAQEQRVRRAIDEASRTDPRARSLMQEFLAKPSIVADDCGCSTAQPLQIDPSFERIAQSDLRSQAAVTDFYALAGPAQIKDLLASMLQYRYKNCFSISDAYSCSGGTVDLYCPALLDYDFWLGGSSATDSSLPDQFRVMERVMRLMQGRFQAYAPFNPWRHAVDKEGPNTYLREIQTAVETRGFIGVKLYPSIGFAPYGNVDVKPSDQPDSWKSGRFPGAAKLDAAMDDLFAWCNKKSVPILAHAGPSFGPDARSAVLGSPENWTKALDRMQVIAQADSTTPASVCFGHTGGAYLPCKHKPAWAMDFADVMGRFSNAYGDLSYWEDFLGACAPKYTNAVETLKAMHVVRPIVDLRLMYGSDWNLLLQEKDWRKYFSRFATALRDSGFDASQVQRLLGPNAVSFLGLSRSSGESNRSRLESLYGRWQVAPAWRDKVDRI